MMNKKNQKGVSLIAAIFIIVVLAFMGVMFVSLINTGSLTSVNDMQSAQALYIAEGGVEYGKEFLAAYSSWYNFATDPWPVAANMALGAGNFTTTINVPATTVRNSFGAGATVVRVYSVDRFPTNGNIAIGAPGVVPTDIRAYTGTTNVGALGPRFTVTPIAPGHTAGDVIYPVVDVGAGGITATATIIPFTGDSTKFLQKGTITIIDAVNGNETLTYTGITTQVAGSFTGCFRTAGAAHAAGLHIVPLPIPDSQEVLITGIGTVSSAGRGISDVVDQ